MAGLHSFTSHTLPIQFRCPICPARQASTVPRDIEPFLEVYLPTSFHLQYYCCTLDAKCYSSISHTSLVWARQQLKPCCSMIRQWTKRLMPNIRCSQAATPLNIRSASKGRMTQSVTHARPSTRAGSTLGPSICSSGTSKARTTRRTIH